MVTSVAQDAANGTLAARAIALDERISSQTNVIIEAAGEAGLIVFDMA